MKVVCPRCRETSQIEEMRLFLRCPACETSLYFDVDSLVQVSAFEPLIGAADAPLHLRRNVDRIPAELKINVKKVVPCWMPFWGVKDSAILHAASSIFPNERIPLPGGNMIDFPGEQPDQAATLIEVDRAADAGAGRRLFFVPFFQVVFFHQGREYRFFLDRINGSVHGTPIAPKKNMRQKVNFIFFLMMLGGFIAGNLLCKNAFQMLIFNPALIIVFYGFSTLLTLRKRASGWSK